MDSYSRCSPSSPCGSCCAALVLAGFIGFLGVVCSLAVHTRRRSDAPASQLGARHHGVVIMIARLSQILVCVEVCLTFAAIREFSPHGDLDLGCATNVLFHQILMVAAVPYAHHQRCHGVVSVGQNSRSASNVRQGSLGPPCQ